MSDASSSESRDQDDPRECSHKQHDGSSPLLVELREHVPFSVFAVVIGIIVAGAICILGAKTDWAIGSNLAADHHDHISEAGVTAPTSFARLFFHLFHPAHMLFSAAATTAMFCRYDRRIFKAMIVGVTGAIGVCGISDIALPQLSLVLLGTSAPWHICVIDHPELSLPFAAVGVIVGLAMSGGISSSTIFSHSLHVLASTMASIFYMVGPLGAIAWIDQVGQIFILTVLAVMIPCCLSDIVYPLLMSARNRQRYFEQGHAH